MARQVELQTSIGNFVVELYDTHAPKTCKNFLELTRRGYYNGTPVSTCRTQKHSQAVALALGCLG